MVSQAKNSLDITPRLFLLFEKFLQYMFYVVMNFLKIKFLWFVNAAKVCKRLLAVKI